MNANDYYPFGMLMPGRKYSASDVYRYGFNGKENDIEVKGEGAQYDYGFRIYDPRIGKFLSIDPFSKNYPWYTTYQFAGNTPIQAIDLDGAEPKGYKWNNPYVTSHPGTGVKQVASEWDNQGWNVKFDGVDMGLMNVYAIQDIDAKTYLIFENATGAMKSQWYVEYDKDGWKGNVNSFAWQSPPNPADVLTAMTVLPLMAVPGLVVYGKAALYYLGEELLEEALGFPVLPDPGDLVQKQIKDQIARSALERLGKTTEESVQKKLKDYVLNKSHPVGGEKAKWFESALGFNQDNLDDLAKQIKFDATKAFKTELTEHGQKYNQVITINGANGKKIEVTFGFIENTDGVVRMTTAIPTKQ